MSLEGTDSRYGRILTDKKKKKVNPYPNGMPIPRLTGADFSITTGTSIRQIDHLEAEGCLWEMKT